MPILTKEVEVKVNSNTVKHYESLGYKIPFKVASKLYQKNSNKKYVYDFDTPIKVKVEHLTKGSKAPIKVLCDICFKNSMNVAYQTYNRVVEKTGSYVCKDCASQKQQLTSLKKYGVPYYTYTNEFKERVAKTFMDKYGCQNISQSPIIKEKKSKTFFKNSSQKSSRQQRYICGLYQGILNFPIKLYCADVFLLNDNLIVEFDGSGHMLNVSMGRETIEEYNQKEIIRNNIIKREGYKQIKIVSSKDLLPSDEILLQMLSEARQYFSETNHSWCSYDIDQGLLFNAEHKDGIPYSFGELRRIKDSDLPEIDNNTNQNLKGA